MQAAGWNLGVGAATIILLSESRMVTMTTPARVQVIQNLVVPQAPRHVTTLTRFSALQYLSLSGLDGLESNQVCRAVLQAPGSFGCILSNARIGLSANLQNDGLV